ncbi:hypothetical protein RGU73_06645 [Neobacillus cucumis]|nr:hypothetical protein [Neobacillus cucumis]MDR4946070.1 hypothetical protein [Neobacillus cucumis]
MSASLGVHWNSSLLNEKFNVDIEVFKPNAVILGYPLVDYQLLKEKVETVAFVVIKGFWEVSGKAVFGTSNPSDGQLSEVSPFNYGSSQTPSTFIWHTADGNLVMQRTL